METKVCCKCNVEKTVTDFSRSKQHKDGLWIYCKPCDNKRNRKDYWENDGKTKGRVYMRKRRLTDEGRESDRESCKRYRKSETGKKWFEKYKIEKLTESRARDQVRRAVRNGYLKRLPCEVCGKKTGIHGHHDDYSKPLEVIWLCPAHHKERHMKLGWGIANFHKLVKKA